MVCALVRGSAREVKRGWQGQKPLIFMRFHGVFLGSQHAMWSKQHNGKVRSLPINIPMPGKLSFPLSSAQVLWWTEAGLFKLRWGTALVLCHLLLFLPRSGSSAKSVLRRLALAGTIAC